MNTAFLTVVQVGQLVAAVLAAAEKAVMGGQDPVASVTALLDPAPVVTAANAAADAALTAKFKAQP